MSKSRKPRKPRDLVTLGMLLYCKSGGNMRDRRERRSKDARREREDFDF